VQQYKNIKIEKSKWAEFKHIAVNDEKSLQDIIDEALSLYLKYRKTSTGEKDA
jgi:hypothetical protein